MIPWQIMARALQDAPSLIRDRMELVKQVIYPIETLPITGLILASFASLVSLALYVGLSLAAGKAAWSLLLLPVPLVLLAGFLLGTGWLFSIVGVVFKDLREIVAVVMGLLVYLSPVVLTRELVGDRVWAIVLLNPLAHVVICFRDVLQSEFHSLSWVVFASLTTVVLILGGMLIAHTKILINEYL
jgi:lipopolysaccharide transport system permease protein